MIYLHEREEWWRFRYDTEATETPLRLALFLADPYHHLTTSFAKFLYAPAGYLSKRVGTTNHYPRYTMRNDKVSTRRRFAVMTTRL